MNIQTVLIFGTLALGAGSESISPQIAGKGWKACSADINRLCKDVRPGNGRIGTCLFEHAKELSSSCKRFAGHGGPGHELESLKDIDRPAERRTPTKQGDEKKTTP